jgi:hypothetical protein
MSQRGLSSTGYLTSEQVGTIHPHSTRPFLKFKKYAQQAALYGHNRRVALVQSTFSGCDSAKMRANFTGGGGGKGRQATGLNPHETTGNGKIGL